MLLIVTSVCTLQCFRCTYNDLKSDTFIPDAVENIVLDSFRLASDVRCGMDNFNEDQYIVNVRNCPVPDDRDRYMAKCAVIRGTTTGHITYASCELTSLMAPICFTIFIPKGGPNVDIDMFLQNIIVITIMLFCCCFQFEYTIEYSIKY